MPGVDRVTSCQERPFVNENRVEFQTALEQVEKALDAVAANSLDQAQFQDVSGDTPLSLEGFVEMFTYPFCDIWVCLKMGYAIQVALFKRDNLIYHSIQGYFILDRPILAPLLSEEKSDSDWFLPYEHPTIVDIQYVCSMERMVASAMFFKAHMVLGIHPMKITG